MSWQEDYRRKVVSIEDAAKLVQSGDMVVTALGVGACSPDIYNAILDRHEELEDLVISDTVQLRPCKLYDPDFMAQIDGRINHAPAFGMITIRKMHRAFLSDFFPAATSDAGDKYAETANVFIVMVTPPNKQGYVNLGLTNFYTPRAIREGRERGNLRIAIAEVNDQMPVIFGDNWLHISEFDYFVENSTPLPVSQRGQAKETEKAIGQYVLELINDGDTIQMGLGGISETVVGGLEGKHDLGVISEMLPVGLDQLVAKGIVTNARKKLHKGKTLATFCVGDMNLYRFAEENPTVEFYPAEYTTNPTFLAQHDNLIAMNSAIMVDFSGQINSEGVGHRQISGSGGQLDFMLGAYWSKGGKGITLLTSTQKQSDGSIISSIVPELPPGSPVTVPRTFADYVISEYGIARLKYKTRRQRAAELIAIAHPDLRGELRNSLRKNFYPAQNS